MSEVIQLDDVIKKVTESGNVPMQVAKVATWSVDRIAKGFKEIEEEYKNKLTELDKELKENNKNQLNAINEEIKFYEDLVKRATDANERSKYLKLYINAIGKRETFFFKVEQKIEEKNFKIEEERKNGKKQVVGMIVGKGTIAGVVTAVTKGLKILAKHIK